MKKTISILVLFIAFLSFASAQMTSAKSLKPNIDNNSVICIDARSAADYNKSHVKGAINIDVETLCSNNAMQSASTMASVFASNGVSKNSAIVIYCKTGVRAGRMYFILKYLGATNVKCLHGNMAGWVSSRYPVTNKATTKSGGSFSAGSNSAMVCDKAYVTSKLGSATTVILDTREAADYNAGHIDGAVNIPYAYFNNPETKLKSSGELASLFNNKGVTSNKEVIVYCKTSSSASYAWFILHELLSYPNVKVFDGGYSAWN
jgi:thiosulfate/3-mercaptopyruvate sulfurtransferase